MEPTYMRPTTRTLLLVCVWATFVFIAIVTLHEIEIVIRFIKIVALVTIYSLYSLHSILYHW